MDDLIRRSDVIEEVYKRIGADLTLEEIQYFEKIIESIPTAYNVDKVKKYFNDKINSVKQTPYINDYLQNLGMQTIMVNIIDDLLRIVEKGDVDDETDLPFM